MLRMIGALVLGLLVFPISFTYAYDKTETPVIGYVSGEYLYLPTYVSKHGAVPAHIYAYYEKGELSGTLRRKDSLIGPEERTASEAPEAGYAGRFVYRLGSSRVQAAYQQVLIFRNKKDLKYEKGQFSDTHSNVVWKIVRLTSSEGFHDYLQTIKDGKCISFIDYYYYVPYDTEPADNKSFNEARCGQEIKPAEVHP